MNVCRLPLVAHPACFARLHAVQCISQNLRADILCLYAQYHDDGERGLGQFVASVSLGSDAIMSFRSKAAKKPRRAAAKAGDEVDADADADDEGDDGASGKKNKGNKSRVVLKARLKHGHVLIMEVCLLSSSLRRRLPKLDTGLFTGSRHAKALRAQGRARGPALRWVPHLLRPVLSFHQSLTRLAFCSCDCALGRSGSPRAAPQVVGLRPARGLVCALHEPLRLPGLSAHLCPTTRRPRPLPRPHRRAASSPACPAQRRFPPHATAAPTANPHPCLPDLPDFAPAEQRRRRHRRSARRPPARQARAGHAARPPARRRPPRRAAPPRAPAPADARSPDRTAGCAS